MSFNNLMHTRNLYKNAAPDFEKLAQKSAHFRQYLRETKPGHWTVNFKDPEALRALTQVLLEQDFGLNVSLPLDRLIPTVPLRLNYILWIEDLLACLPDQPRGTTVRGFDIGTGASAIYPLLGAKLNGWHFFATEVDDASVVYAKQNITRNKFDDLIKVQKVSHGCYLKAPLENEASLQFDFCMCNPPFFTSLKATSGTSRTGRRPQPNAVCTGSETEMVTTGGEVEFVNGIVADSLLLKEQFSWYTTMLGKKASLAPVIASLKEHHVPTVTTTEFGQGRVMRWGVAWSFMPGVAVEDSPTKRRKHQKKAKPLQIIVPEEYASEQIGSSQQEPQTKTQRVATAVLEILKGFKVGVEEVHASKDHPACVEMQRRVFCCTAVEKTWDNQRRKRRKMRRQCEEETEMNSDELKNKLDEDKKSEQERETRDFEPVNKESSSGGNRRRARDMESETTETSKTVPSNPDMGRDGQASSSCSFFVRVGPGAALSSDEPAGSVVLEMEWINGDNKNDLYQLYQYFQNKIVKGCT